MSFEDAVAMANKLDADLAEDFEFRDGEYFYRNAAAVVEAYNGYNEELQEELNQRTSDEIAKLRGFKLSSLREGNTEAANNYQAQIDDLQESQALVDEELEKYTDYLTNIALLNAGFYDEFVNQINEQDTEKLEAATSSGMLGAARQGEQALRKYFSDRGIEVENSYIEAIMNNIDSLNSDIVSMVLEAVENGSTSIDIAHLTEGTDLSALTSINISDAGVIQAFAQIFGSNTKAYNEAMVSYIEATQKDYQSIFEDITSNPHEVDLSTVQELANILGMGINEVINLYFRKNLDGTYSVLDDKLEMMSSHLEGIDPAVTNLENTEELIKDSIIAYTEEILGYISSGISGDLSNVEFSKLGEYIASLTDGQVSLSFERTAEGIKLTQSSLLQIYSTLQAENSLAAQIVLDELTESAMDADENLNNIYKVMERIAEINEELSTAGISDEREKALRAELALAENIRDTLMEAGDAFNFMDQDLPTGMTNPLSAWEGMGDAFKVLDGEDFKADRIGFQDFYNMITMMGDDVLAAAGIFTNDSQTAADLIEAGAAALTNVDGETFVDLSKLGTNFNLGAEGMKEGLTEGIHTLAENQIEMLDAEIALLETVVKTQEAFDSISGDDNKIDLSEFSPITDRFGKAHWKPQQETLLQTLSEYTGGVITIGNETIDLAKLINNPNTWGTISPEAQQKLVDYINTIHNLTSGIDWSLSPTENFEAFKTLATQLQESGLDINWNSLIDSWTSGLDETSAEEIKRKIIQHLGGTISEEGTITIPYTYGNATFEMIQTESGEPIFKSPLGFEGKTPQEALEKEYEAQGGADLYGDIENYKIVMGYTIEPQAEIDPEALAELDGEVRKKIAEVINGDGKVTEDTVGALVSLGFEVQVGDELSSDQIAALRSALNIEDKIINLTVNTEGISENIVGVLDGTVTEIPVTLNLGTGEEGESLSVNADSVIVTVPENGLKLQGPNGANLSVETLTAIATAMGVTSGDIFYSTDSGGRLTSIGLSNALDSVTGATGKLELHETEEGFEVVWSGATVQTLPKDYAFEDVTGITNTLSITPSASFKPTFDANGNLINLDLSEYTLQAVITDLDTGLQTPVTVTIPIEPDTTVADFTSAITNKLIEEGFSATEAGVYASDIAASVGITGEIGEDTVLSDLIAAGTLAGAKPVYFKPETTSTEAQSQLDQFIAQNQDRTINLNVNVNVGQSSSIISGYDELRTGLLGTYDTPGNPIEYLGDGSVYGGGYDNADALMDYLTRVHEALALGKQISPDDLAIITTLSELEIPEGSELYDVFNSVGSELDPNELDTIAEYLTAINGIITAQTPTEEGNTLQETLNGLGLIDYTPIIQAIADITTNSTSLSSLDFSNFNSFIDNLINLSGENGTVVSGLQSIKEKLEELTDQGYNIELAYNITSTSDAEGTYDVTINDNGTAETLTNLGNALTHLNTQATALKDSANAIETTGPDNVKALKEQINNLQDKSTAVGNTADAIARLDDKSITATVTVRVITPNPQPGSQTSSVVRMSKAKGNVALAKGTGKAAAKGKTLMGELGPELVVSNGRYFTVGNNGAEFVDLPSDAIVFNHLQTKKLLGSGGMVGTGEPVTNERNAVALAGGNVNGPAMASASDALAELYKLRAMWQGLLDASANELGKKAGGLGSGKGPGGGGGGSGGGSGEDSGAVLADIERWYNLLREIAKLEQQITMEQAKRENMRNGYDYSASLQKELKLLEKQRAANAKLAEEQKKYYEQRRADLNATDYSKIFTYDEDGLMQYVEEDGLGLDILAHLNATDENGKAIYDAKDQLKELQETFGFDISVLKTNADGTKAEDEEQMMQNFWDGIDGWMEEMDSLYDSYNDAAIATEEATAKMNEILQEYIDNQLDVEQKLLKAIEDREQAEIDRIQEEKDLLEEAAQEYIDGLSEALDKERSMYEKNETDAETARLQRQLAILQRSGGSASEIKSLQDQIDSRLQDAYFQEQQDQIDAIQEASNNQIEKLQTQIDIMTETLEYQKENGLLWNEVFEMMQTWTPEAMLQFIQEFTQEQQENSPTQNEQDNQETLGQLQMYTVDRDWKEYYDGLDYSDEIKEEHKAGAYEAFAEAYATGGEAAAITAANEYYKQATTTPPETPPANGGGGGGDSTPPDDNKKKIQFNRGTEQYWTYKNSKREGKGQIFYGNKKSPVVEVVDETDNMYQISGKDGKGTTFTNRWISKKTSKGKNIWKAYKTGGLVDYTGPAWVDGSKRKPEAFLSAEDTAMLKSKIFSNSDGSLKALVSALEEITSNTSHYSNSNAISEQIVIQNAQVNIQPGTISNDYDARRAGEMALEEMVKIARKTTNRVVSR